MRYAAFDLGSSTGYCVVDTDTNRWVWGILDLSGNRYEGGGARYLRFRRHLRDTFLPKVHAVYYEAVKFMKFAQAAEVLNGLRAELMAECEDATPKIPYEGVGVGELKKFATGKGNASKAKMAEALEARWRELPCGHEAPPDFKQGDIVDAIWIAVFAFQRLTPEVPASPVLELEF